MSVFLQQQADHSLTFEKIHCIDSWGSPLDWVYTLTWLHDIYKLSFLWFKQTDCRLAWGFTASLCFFVAIVDSLFDCMCGWCYSLNITISFPFFHLVSLIPLSALDVGEAAASALPPTLSLHYSLAYHTVVLLPPALHHGPPSFVFLQNMLQNLARMFTS